MSTICKIIISGAPAARARELTAGLASAPLRDLAVQLAADPDLTVSVITCNDGRDELEVLHTGGPPRTEHDIDQRRFTRPDGHEPARTVSITGPAGFQDALALVRGILRDAAARPAG